MVRTEPAHVDPSRTSGLAGVDVGQRTTMWQPSAVNQHAVPGQTMPVYPLGYGAGGLWPQNGGETLPGPVPVHPPPFTETLQMGRGIDVMSAHQSSVAANVELGGSWPPEARTASEMQWTNRLVNNQHVNDGLEDTF